MKLHNPFKNLTKFEYLLYISSVLLVFLSFLLQNERETLTLIASLIGVTALIFCAKGDVWGQALIVVFSLFYAVISFRFRYYGEMITYLGMSAPIAMMSVVSWMRNPFEKGKPEVKVEKLTKAKIIIIVLLNIIVTTAFYFILKYFGNANLIVSTFSVTTSFFAASLTFLRISSYALAYALNDVVLIILWVSASIKDPSYLPMVICFVVFLANDLYGFYNWQRMRKRQNAMITKIL